jgi:hypothetical protein
LAASAEWQRKRPKSRARAMLASRSKTRRKTESLTGTQARGAGTETGPTNRAAETEREEGPKKTNRPGSVWQEITEENKMEKPAACLDLRKGKNRAVTRATDRSRARWCRQKNQILERETMLWVRTWPDRKQSRAAKTTEAKFQQ